MITELWKPVPGFPAYDVSNQGRVRSYWVNAGSNLWHTAEEPQRILRPSTMKDGYLKVTICAGPKRHHTRAVAHLVIEAFVGPRPNKMQVCHTDGDLTNNHLDNLCYNSPVANNADKTEAARHAGKKLTEEQVVKIRERYANNKTLTCVSLASEYGVSKSNISFICRGTTFPHLGGPITKYRKLVTA